MCGRNTHRHTWAEKVALYRLTAPAVAPNEFIPRYNLAPTQSGPVVRERDGRRELAMLRWGLIPWWARDAKIAYKTISARAETVPTAPSDRDAWAARRCPIPSSGFYEWVKTAGGKQPYLICFKDDRLFSFGGLWESWKDRQSGERVETYTIITCPPNELAGRIHNRMPLIIDPADYDRWLTAAEPPADLLRPYPATDIEARPVSKGVNKPDVDEPSLIEPIGLV
jgi:putative SOS response-associated peptidase YedK